MSDLGQSFKEGQPSRGNSIIKLDELLTNPDISDDIEVVRRLLHRLPSDCKIFGFVDASALSVDWIEDLNKSLGRDKDIRDLFYQVVNGERSWEELVDRLFGSDEKEGIGGVVWLAREKGDGTVESLRISLNELLLFVALVGAFKLKPEVVYNQSVLGNVFDQKKEGKPLFVLVNMVRVIGYEPLLKITRHILDGKLDEKQVQEQYDFTLQFLNLQLMAKIISSFYSYVSGIVQGKEQEDNWERFKWHYSYLLVLANSFYKIRRDFIHQTENELMLELIERISSSKEFPQNLLTGVDRMIVHFQRSGVYLPLAKALFMFNVLSILDKMYNKMIESKAYKDSFSDQDKKRFLQQLQTMSELVGYSLPDGLSFEGLELDKPRDIKFILEKLPALDFAMQRYIAEITSALGVGYPIKIFSNESVEVS